MTSRRYAVAALMAAALATSAAGASTAGAAFHLIKVREVYPGAADSSYVVLQMMAAGENFVGGHRLRLYDTTGATLDTFTFSAGYVAPNGGHGNNTILVGDTGVQSAFPGIAPDDKADANLNVPAGGGAVCWLDGQPPDCVAWGDFSGGALPPPGAGIPAAPAGIPPGMALRRTIAPNCPTFLEAADDSDSSAADFLGVFPLPRPNSFPPPERRCSTGGGTTGGAGEGAGGGGASPGTGPSRSRPPRTRIVRGPGRVTRDRTPTFRFRADRRASFRCRIDGRRARRCRSPFTWRRLRYGCHAFRVRARSGRRVDRTPAVYRFRIVRQRQPGLRQFRRCRRSAR